jgi:hypothetical protein
MAPALLARAKLVTMKPTRRYNSNVDGKQRRRLGVIPNECDR